MNILKPENIKAARAWQDKYDGYDAPFIMFWSEDSVKIDGSMNLQQLRELVELMESFS